jgi:4-alpha-glucanotransferase
MVAGLGAGALLINPLSAAAPILPQQASPYFPSSRRFRNPLYLCVPESRRRAGRRGDWRNAADARALNQIRRWTATAFSQLKMQALETIWEGTGDDPVSKRSSGSRARICRFSAPTVRWPSSTGATGEFGRSSCATRLRRPSGRFAAAHEDRIRFHAWLQWLLDQQLADAAAICLWFRTADRCRSGRRGCLAMAGCPGAGSDGGSAAGSVQCRRPELVPAAVHPAPAETGRFRPFIQTIRAALRHAGGLRIDHVMGLFRLFWIPDRFPCGSGTYVRYPADELLAVVAVESHRAGAWIAGEDLGTVEPLVRQRCTRTGCCRIG